MGCTIRVTRGDDGLEFTNEHLAALLRSLPGVVSVKIEPLETVKFGEHEIPVVRDADCPPDQMHLVAINVEDGAQRFPCTVDAGPYKPASRVMFASVKQADVDAYLERQAERMGHTEMTRG
jgi:hypothetical protein